MKLITNVTGKVLGTGRNVYLAGLGLASIVTDQSTKAFETLVEKGRTRSAEGEENKVTEAANKVNIRVKDLAEKVTDRAKEGISATVARFGIPSRDEINELSRSVDKLTEKIKTLQTA